MDTRKIYFEQAITRVHDRIIEPSGNVYTPCSKKKKNTKFGSNFVKS